MDNYLKILIVENSIDDAELMLSEIEKSGFVTSSKIVGKLDEVNKELNRIYWDCILCDHELVGFDAFDVLAIVKGAGLEIPLIIVTREISEESVIKAMKLGARDYIKKSNIKRLGPIIHREINDAGIRRAYKENQQELILEKDRLAITLSSIGDGVITTDTLGKISMLNEKAEILTGWKSIDAINKPLHEVFRLLDKITYEAAENLYERIMDNGTTVGLKKHTILLASDGTERYVSASGAPIKDNKGSITGTVIVFRDITQIKKAEDIIINEQKNFAAVFYEAPVGMLILEETGVIKNANKAFEKMAKIEMSEIIGQRIGSSIACINSYNSKGGCGYGRNCSFCKLRYTFEHVWKTENPIRGLELQHISKIDDAELCVWYRTSLQPIILDGKKNIMITLDDITAQKQLSVNLQKSEEKLRQITDNILELIIKCNKNGIIEYASPSVNNLLGYSIGELIGTSVIDYLHDEDAENIKRKFVYNISEYSKGSAEFRFRKKDGSFMWVDVNGNVLYDSSGIINGALLVGRDITQDKQMQKAIIESERRYRGLFESASDIIFTYDVEGTIKSINRAGEEILGYNLQEISKMNVSELMVLEYLEGKYDFQSDLQMIENERHTVEINVYNKDGERITLEINRQIIYSEGIPAGVQGIARDITKRKKIEAELQRAKDEAEAANLAKSEFLANMSHEIRTPMNGITGMLDLLMYTKLDNEQKEYLDIIKSCVDSLLKVLNDILDFSKIEAGKLLIESIDFDIRDLIEKLVIPYTVKAKEKGLNLKSCIEKNVPSSIKGDPLRLKQILNNLIGNAVKFTDYGEIEIKVEKYDIIDERIQLKFEIRDTGIGIAEEEMVKLFKSFSQVDGSFTRKYSGTGLGLAITKRLVEMMGGTIWVESEKGEGSVFHFIVFFGTSRDKAINSIPVVSKTEHHQDSIINILLVEDNRMNQIAVSSLLLKKGYNIEIASNGKEALNMLKDKSYDLILMDIQMPEMDGIETTRRIRDTEKLTGGHIPIIALTAYALQGDGERFISEGMDFYVAKPIRLEELFGAIVKAGALTKENKEREQHMELPILQAITTAKEEIIDDEKKEQHKHEMYKLKEYIAKLEEAIKINNYVIIEQCAHRIKETSKNTYMNRLKNYAFKIELSARKQKLNDVVRSFDALKNELKEIEH